MEEEISPEEARAQFHATTAHGRMPNGEVRLRLTSGDGGGYVKTIQPNAGAWQNSHSHQSLTETYVVQAGWIAIAELEGGALTLRLYLPGDVVSTRPGVAHNVYMSAGAVTHTIKNGGAADWRPEPKLDALVSHLTEGDIRARVKTTEAQPTLALREKFLAYSSMYNNLDNILWVVPGAFLTAGVAALGLLVQRTSFSPLWLGSGLILLGVLFFLGGYTIMRMRHHHSILGQEMQRIEGDGYFSRRAKTLRSLLLPSAPHLLMGLFFLVAALSLAIGILAVIGWPPMIALLDGARAH